jgi:hypothetical protein
MTTPASRPALRVVSRLSAAEERRESTHEFLMLHRAKVQSLATPPSLTNEEATYLTSMADSCRSESNDADDQALCSVLRRNVERARTSF